MIHGAAMLLNAKRSFVLLLAVAAVYAGCAEDPPSTQGRNSARGDGDGETGGDGDSDGVGDGDTGGDGDAKGDGDTGDGDGDTGDGNGDTGDGDGDGDAPLKELPKGAP